LSCSVAPRRIAGLADAHINLPALEASSKAFAVIA